MPRFEADIRLDLSGDQPECSFSAAANEFRLRVYRELKLRTFSSAWIRLQLDQPKAKIVLARFRQLYTDRQAVLGYCLLKETLLPEERAQAPWFLIGTKHEIDSFSLWDDYPRCNYGTLPASRNILNDCFVSERFVDAYREATLTGLEFLRCRNKGRKSGRPWFAARATAHLGNGLDHPWFLRERWEAMMRHDPRSYRDQRLESGQWSFHQALLKPNLSLPEPVAQLLSLVDGEPTSVIRGVKFLMVPRFLEAHLPSVDFAYLCETPDGPNADGKMMRFRRLAVRAPAARRLIERGILIEKELFPVRAVSGLDAGHVERPDEPACPMWTDGEWRALKEQEGALR